MTEETPETVTVEDEKGETRTIAFTKRDQLDIERIVGKPLGTLFTTHEGQIVPTGEYQLAAQYIAEQKLGLTEDDWDDWLDQSIRDVEVEFEVDPT